MFGPRKNRLLALLLAVSLAGLPAARGQEAAGQRAAPASSPNPPDPKKARKAFQLAEQAENDGDWQRAFEFYSEATRQSPQTGNYLMRREAARFQLVQMHMDRAERAAVTGRLEEARAELDDALTLDPTYTVAQERMEQLRPRPARTLESVAGSEAGLPQLQPQPGIRSFDYRGESRGAFEDVAKQFGLTASFDPDLRARQIRFRVADVDFETAMRVLAQQTRTFWQAVDVHTFFVADNTPQKRRELEPSVVRTAALSGLATPEQLTEITRLVREIGGITRTQLDTRTRTLTLRGSPLAVSLATRLIAELEQAVGEMMLEIDVLEVDRDAASRLGITPPTSARTFTVSPLDVKEAQQSTEALLRVLQRIFGSSGGTTGAGLAGLIPPLIAIGGGKTIVLATLPGATADFLDALTVVRHARRVLLRAQDSQPATFFIGERFPIALATLQPNLLLPLAAAVTGGTFPRTDVEAADGPTAIVAADFDLDGHLDFAVANKNANSVSIFFGNGDGTFRTRVDVPLGITVPQPGSPGASPSAIAAGDFNQDGRPDLVVTNEGDDSISILLQERDSSGNFKFIVQPKITVGDSPRGVVVADFNNDGRPDIAVANSGSDSVSVFRAEGAPGSFTLSQTIQNVGDGPSALAAGNLNAGTVPDLVVANENANTIAVLLGNNSGNGTFTFSAAFNVGQAPRAVLIIDFNGNGLQDVAVANHDSDSVTLLLGDGKGGFTSFTEFAVGDGPMGLAPGDFNVDGQQDLAVVNREADSVTILLGSGGGGFALRADFATGDAPTSVVAVDFNSDGRRDLAITDRDGDAVSIILNQVTLAPPGSISTTGLQAPYPGFQYEDLGLKVRATPRLHPDHEVTLQLQIEIRSRTGQNINGIPVISNRTLEQTVRLRENEHTLLTGIIQPEERLGITGWPGLAHIPGVGRAVSRRDRDRSDSELLIVITPRRIRLADRAGSLLYVGREPGTTGGTGGPPQ